MNKTQKINPEWAVDDIRFYYNLLANRIIYQEMKQLQFLLPRDRWVEYFRFAFEQYWLLADDAAPKMDPNIIYVKPICNKFPDDKNAQALVLGLMLLWCYMLNNRVIQRMEAMDMLLDILVRDYAKNEMAQIILGIIDNNPHFGCIRHHGIPLCAYIEKELLDAEYAMEHQLELDSLQAEGEMSFTVPPMQGDETKDSPVDTQTRPKKSAMDWYNAHTTLPQQRIFEAAEDAGYLQSTDTGFEWLKERALLDYFLGCVFCGDKTIYSEKKYKWVKGTEKLPCKQLEQLFNRPKIGAYRNKRADKEVPPPDNFKAVDNIIEKAK